MDTPGDKIGAVLSQQGKPIAFMCRALGITTRSRSTYAKEMLAIVEAIRVWQPYLLGRKYFIQTNHHSLKYFLEQRVATPEQQKWVAKLLGYDYEIIYRPGHENSAADALLRKPNSPILLHIHVPEVEIWEEIRQASKDDIYVKSVGHMVEDQVDGPYKWRNGLLLFKNEEEGVILLEPQHILDTRWVKHGSTFVKESLVQWKHLPAEEARWENTQLLLDQFSNVDLEDKSPLGGGSVDEPRRSARLPKPNPKYQG
ncbi:hypothetical protein F0562_003617 [Nyssa sinensis]|uniref:Reverse transcriptase RNase H-like domain-containing protein n=1 Tax=Nyssa sinensis TaxID=561372 RepID=A0A5J5BWX9_9ASTE|nr:hypothetical protein F0562_003617 [Nyssa sinensis]